MQSATILCIDPALIMYTALFRLLRRLLEWDELPALLTAIDAQSQ